MPNAEPRDNGGRIYAYAIKNIAADEEITYDYGKEYWNAYIKPFGCRCPKCTAERAKNKSKTTAKKSPQKKTAKKKK